MTRLHQDWDLVQGCGKGDGAACAFVDGVGEVVVVELVGWEVDGDGFGAFCDNGLYQEACGAQVELVFDCEGGFVGGVDVVVWLEDGGAGDGC